MPNPRFETAIGVVDDVNVSFNTSVSYVAGTLAVFRNGVLQERTSENGWIELGGDAFDMKVAPIVDDVLQVFYMDTQPSPDPGVVEEVEEIHCVLDDDDDLTTTLEDADAIMCVLDDDDNLIGELEETGEMSCVLDDDDDIVGILEEC